MCTALDEIQEKIYEESLVYERIEYIIVEGILYKFTEDGNLIE